MNTPEEDLYRITIQLDGQATPILVRIVDRKSSMFLVHVDGLLDKDPEAEDIGIRSYFGSDFPSPFKAVKVGSLDKLLSDNALLYTEILAAYGTEPSNLLIARAIERVKLQGLSIGDAVEQSLQEAHRLRKWIEDTIRRADEARSAAADL